MKVCINEQSLLKKYNELEERFLKISPDNTNRYAVLKETVIRRFLQYGREDINDGQFERAAYVYNCLLKLTEELENGELLYWNENPEANGAKADGYAMINKDGRPVFYCGYGHFDQLKEDIPNMNDFGCNTVQFEMGPYNVLYPAGTFEKWGMADDDAFKSGDEYIYSSGEFEVNLSYLKKSILPFLETAERKNVAVCLLLSPHYEPKWFLEKYPETKSKNLGFIHYNIYHPKSKEMIETYLRAVVPIIKEYPALQSICLTNEPGFNTMYDCQDKEVLKHNLLPIDEAQGKSTNLLYEWQKHLRDSYNDIQNFNENFDTEYKNFSEILMPDGADDTPLFYEWYVWNNRCFADWHKWMANIIKEIAPEIPVHVKFVPTFGTYDMPAHRRSVKHGVDPEQFAQFSDFSGNDCFSFEGRDHLPLTFKLEWYDYLASLKRMPIDNSEDHVIEDRDTNYEEIQATRIYADIWQGAIHGRTLTQLWVWKRTNMPRANANGSILHRPDCVEAVGRASLDLNRLAADVAAMQEVKKGVAILFSNTSRIYNINYTKEMFTAYEGLLYAGLRPYFITEDKIDMLENFELLVMPGIRNLYKNTADKIAEFIDCGKPVLAVDSEGTLLKDEHNKPLNTHIFDKAIWIDSCAYNTLPDRVVTQKVTDAVLSIIENELSVVSLDGENYNIEWCYKEIGSRRLINICNYDKKTRTVQLLDKKNEAMTVKDLISGRTMSLDDINLDAYRIRSAEG